MITLFLGGVRSGKSQMAERLARASSDQVLYVATAVGDPSMADRIAAHQIRRPAAWETMEVSMDQMFDALDTKQGCVLVDSLGAWLAQYDDLDADGNRLCKHLGRRRGDTIIVSEEVGLSVHPVSEVGRRFQDQLGRLNQLVAAQADRSYLVAAGQVVELSDPPWDEV
ncbi:MAG: bifunctional adenosylcobinamide kinase/adenosylcobinamide-phosphate guanylyltransferase [Acidimicrobiales bacterium]